MAYANDIEAEKLLQRHSTMVYRLAIAQMKNKHDAEDIFQTVFLRVVKYQPEFENAEHEKAWFIRTTINCCKTVFAKRWYRKTEQLLEEVSMEDVYQEDSILKLVHSLPDKYRGVIHLYYYEDMSIQHIADALDKGENTIKSLLHRGRKLLKHMLEEERET